ncbi:hypothetical protein IE989_10260 [Klebsiella pneumoniae]|nr:hypothetical protein [Klebsiella pneumoniae]
MSWHWVFIVTGGIGIIWSLIWFKVYQPPRLTKSISKAELDYIRDGGGLGGWRCAAEERGASTVIESGLEAGFSPQAGWRLPWTVRGNLDAVVLPDLGFRTT